MAQAHDPYGALRFRDFRLLMAGNLLAGLGLEMQAVTIGWEIYERTGSAWDLGLVGLAQFLPVLLLSLPAGAAADRYSRKGLLLGAQLIQVVASLGLAYLSFQEGPIPLVFLCLLLVGVGRAFSSPCRWALAPQVVPANLLNNAVAWNSSGWQVALLTGPALGGLVIALREPAIAYLLTATSAWACAVLIAVMRIKRDQRAPEPPSLDSFIAGIHFVWRTKPILATITLDLFAVLLGGATALLPMFAKDILKVGPVGLGFLRGAPSAGAIVMAVALAHLPPLRQPGKAILAAVGGFGAATIAFGLSENFLLSLVMLFLTGALDAISVVVRATLVQVLTPDAMRGRVSAVNSVFIGSSNELGAFESGAAAELLGPVAAVVLGGAGTMVVVVGVMLLWPVVLRLGPLHKITPRSLLNEVLTGADELTPAQLEQAIQASKRPD